MCIIDCLSTIVFILPLHLDYTKVIILILWWRNFQLEYWRTFQLVSTGQHQGKQGVPARQRLGKGSERLRLQPQTVCSRYPRNAPHTAAKPLQVGKRVYRGHGGRDTQLRRPQPCIARGSEVHHGIPQGSRETHPIKITDV